MTVTASAPGKLLLFGEHAVVYGYPCIGTAVDKRIQVSIDATTYKDKITTPGVKNSIFVEKALELFRHKFTINSPVTIATSSNFTDKLGLGSSSAVTVATISALSKLFKKKLSQREIFDLSFEVVLSIQKVGSGFDIAAAVYGGCLYYEKRGKIIVPIKTETMPLLIIYSGIKADTATLINQVRRKYDNNKKSIERLFEDIALIVKQARNGIENKDWKMVGGLMTKNHSVLQKLGVSTDKLDHLVHITIKNGAYGAKLSGAGGGDCIVALVSPEKQSVIKQEVIKNGGEIITI